MVDAEVGPTKLDTITVTIGLWMYFASAFSMSRASCVLSLPMTSMSSTSGTVIRPSGRTGTDVDSSGLRHTSMLIVSPGPIT